MNDQLDALFGFVTLTIDNESGTPTRIKVRRVLNRAQQRCVNDVMKNSTRLVNRLEEITKDANLRELEASRAETHNENVRLGRSTDPLVTIPDRLSESEQDQIAQAAEDELHGDLVRGCTAMIVNVDDLAIETWGITTVGQLFHVLRDMAGKSLREALLASAFPQSGSNG